MTTQTTELPQDKEVRPTGGWLNKVSDLYQGDAKSARMVAQAWLASRGVIFLVALLLAVFEQRAVLDMVNNWDAAHFTNLAKEGYLADPKEMAFFPGLPLLLKVGLVIGVPPQITGMLIAAVASTLAAIALLRMGGPWVATAWLFAPTAVFTAVPYTESLFCAAAFWAWERARADRWMPAVILAAIACTVRVSGLFLIGALFIMIITNRKLDLKTMFIRSLALFIPLGVILGYALYLQGLTGSWTAWYTAQSTGWARSFTTPFESFEHTVAAMKPGAYADHPEWKWVFRGEMIAMILGVVVTGWCLGKRLWAEASWVGIQVIAFSLSYWFFSVNRAILLWFPLWMMLVQWAQWSPKSPDWRWVHKTCVYLGWMVMVGLMITWSWLFFTGRWSS